MTDQGTYIEVRGDTSVYLVTAHSDGSWHCPCVYHGTCSHILAAQIIRQGANAAPAAPTPAAPDSNDEASGVPPAGSPDVQESESDEMAETRLNVHQRLLAVRRAVDAVHKDGDNKSQSYKFVSSGNVLGALRDAVNEAGLVLECRILNTVFHSKWAEGATSTGQKEHLTELHMEFVWVNADNPEEKVVCPWYGQGLDTGEKGVGKALTYGEKYFMLKFFNIPTDGDDPDGDKPGTPKTTTPTLPTPRPAPVQKPAAAPATPSGQTPEDVNRAAVNTPLPQKDAEPVDDDDPFGSGPAEKPGKPLMDDPVQAAQYNADGTPANAAAEQFEATRTHGDSYEAKAAEYIASGTVDAVYATAIESPAALKKHLLQVGLKNPGLQLQAKTDAGYAGLDWKALSPVQMLCVAWTAERITAKLAE